MRRPIGLHFIPFYVLNVVVYSPEEGIVVYIDFVHCHQEIESRKLNHLETQALLDILTPGWPFITKGSHMMRDVTYCALAVCCRIAAVC